jgi:hypothetical protein
MNPYASFLGDLDPRVVIAGTPAKLAAQAGRLGADGLRRSTAPGKWSAAEVICHLADCEVAFGFRIRQTLAVDNHVCQPFDQDAWAKPYAQLDPGAALEQFNAARRWNVALLETVPPAGMQKKLTHPERGEMTLQTVVETMAGHDLNHLAQLERIA